MPVLRAIAGIGLVLGTLASPTGAQLYDNDARLAKSALLEPPRAYPEIERSGRKYWQEMRIYPGEGDGPRPVIVVLLSGRGRDSIWEGWPRHWFNDAGYTLVTIGTRGAGKGAEDVASLSAGLAQLAKRSGALSLDMGRLILAGYGYRGHYAVLFGTDPTLLEGAGIPFASLAGIISYDGEGFDLPARMAEGGYRASGYRSAFGRDPEMLERLSPAAHLDTANAPAFLFVDNATFTSGQEQAAEMAARLEAAGSSTQLVTLPLERRLDRDTTFMVEPDGSGREVLPFVRAAYAAQSSSSP